METKNDASKQASKQAKIGGLLEFVKHKITNYVCHPLLVAGSGAVMFVLICITRPRYKNGVTSHWSGVTSSLKSAFTLVELAIVLVIIGLLAGGVLVGNDLIHAAAIRAQISQIEKYNAAVHIFQVKYNGIPGDLKYTEASAFGLYAITNAAYFSNIGYGDGNGIVQNGTASTPSSTQLQGEPFIFWRQLSDAQLIDGNYGQDLDTSAQSPLASINNVNSYLPMGKIQGTTIEVNSPLDGLNYFLLDGITAISTYGNTRTSTNAITAQEAYSIDQKMDDGLPATGNVFAINGADNLSNPTSWRTVSALGGCVTSSAYAVTQTTQSCSLRFKFQ